MKNVLMAFGGNDFSIGTFEFARQLNEISPILLSCFFLPQVVNPNYELHPVSAKDDGEIMCANNMELFTELCLKNDIDYRIHKGSYELCMPQLIKETRFSDLLIAGSEIFYRSFDDESPQYYLNKALHQSECPVVVLPEEFDFPEKIIFAYDGVASSVYAIKQFTYLFPELCNKSLLSVYANENADADIPNKFKIEELIATHFKHMDFLKLATNFREEINYWLAGNKKSLLVTGSYNRSALAEMVKQSFAKDIIEKHLMPVFIAHR